MKKITNNFFILSVLIFIGCNRTAEKLEERTAVDKNLEIFNVSKKQNIITAEIIDKTSDANLEQMISDNILEWISMDYMNELLRVKSLTKGQQMFWSTWKLEGEVNNGGFNQFYYNSNQEFGQMAEDGFQIIGLEKYAELTHKANKIYKENKLNLEKFDDGTMKSFSESYKNNPLNEIDHEFYELQSK
ncbi:DUF4375 domain-containing protein [Flavobacterium sp. ACN6]|uniref:DMP19 family protein n=1 Tax=Flavobacterium sp. ACN6 TaxID=1920426 RepID=UPI000BB3D24D|nr:DUF4375 domain-containing protein [Flavobacterium sp. ACN6]PBJ09059.1 hypothetical protein BSF42_35410 [Flavobacterium sp. ACN6]